VFSRGFEHLKNQEAKAACMLPNVARYQLRHTPKFCAVVFPRGVIISNMSRHVNIFADD
jgi:hypothetical protein